MPVDKTRTSSACLIACAAPWKPWNHPSVDLPAADDELAVSVANTVRGTNEELATQALRPLMTTKPHGMGLSVSRTIIEAHGGGIWAEPNPGGGAIFRFTLHVVLEHDLADA